jgi:hypothetical protein
MKYCNNSKAKWGLSNHATYGQHHLLMNGLDKLPLLATNFVDI